MGLGKFGIGDDMLALSHDGIIIGLERRAAIINAVIGG